MPVALAAARQPGGVLMDRGQAGQLKEEVEAVVVESRLQCDVVILGGGPAGSATAIALKKNNPSIAVALIESSAYENVRIGETLPPNAQVFLEQLGLWEAFVAENHVAAYGTSSAWGSDELGDNEFIFSPYGHGWHLDRRKFDAWLAREVAKTGVKSFIAAKVISWQRLQHGGWQLTVQASDKQSSEIRAAFVVDATGRRAAFASQQGARKVLFDRLVGVFVYFAVADAPPLTDTYTLVESWEHGWWYSALLPNAQVVVACMSDSDFSKKYQLHLLPQWLAQLSKTRYTARRLQNARPLTQPAAHAAYSHRLDRITGDGWLAVGDAATTFDPLSSQGILKALHSGLLAAYAIHDYLRAVPQALEKFEARIARAFETYLDTRIDYYLREQRWPDSIFWQRRYGHITLDPQHTLCFNASVKNMAALESLHMHLSITDLKRLCRLCESPQSAHALVSAFIQSDNTIQPKRIILALQYLIDEGIIVMPADQDI